MAGIDLERRDDDQGFSRRSLTLGEDGSLVLDGHDLGRHPESIWGPGLSEYEFARTIHPSGVQRIRELLDLEPAGDPLARLAEQFSGRGGSRRFEEWLEAHGIESEFWSRVGD